ncbi:MULTISPECIES: NAD(P)-dependent oxidoreductase [Ramlibacter]|uniref:NAD(P)-dependent oxidoreductase n=1 Tax=Ramlibacter aquaticus TaxID=2780094 RepID=A0ABR9SH69_9BURK|nr:MULTISPECIES: NAD(P)-dependent oxidoreductase [Ramlibacter]MBE7941706.1 NAD(P)-dependent oxidoreductase [Ramlibacter aquaticus]
MNVLVLGGSGYIGSALVRRLAQDGVQVVAASRHAQGPGQLTLDTQDTAALAAALRGADAVVNCVAGSGPAIAGGARALARAAQQAGCGRIVHLSSLSVYGALEGEAREDAPLDGGIGWYAQAKIEAEQALAAYAGEGGRLVVLRPGCVWGPGSALWVDRIARLLRAGRLGDLGAGGDGWSNLVALDDVAAAVAAGLRLRLSPCEARIYNLAAPDSPRWNDYFRDLALAIGATPLRRVSARRLRLDAKLMGPPLKLLEIAARRLGRDPRALPVPLPPGLLGVFERQLRLRSELAEEELGLRWTPYAQVLSRAVDGLRPAAGAAPVAAGAA